MRNTAILSTGFEDIKTLYQYLYLSPDNFLDFVSSDGRYMRVKMDDECNFVIMFLGEGNSTKDALIQTDIAFLLTVIRNLKEQPAIETINKFNNRWEEIQHITKYNLALKNL